MSTQETKLKDIADAIRAKEGSSDPIIANDFPARIAAIQTGTDTSDATATAGDILSGETAYVASGKVTGTIPTKTGSNISVSGPTIIVPSGYYGSQVSKSVATATQATPTISVNSSGLITASSTQSAGYVTAGTKNATKQLTTQAGKTITPGTSQQTAVASGRYTTGPVYVAGDSDLVASNIKKGINIFGVTGTYEVSLQSAVCEVENSGSEFLIRAPIYNSNWTVGVYTLTPVFFQNWGGFPDGTIGIIELIKGSSGYECYLIGVNGIGGTSGTAPKSFDVSLLSTRITLSMILPDYWAGDNIYNGPDGKYIMFQLG